MFVSHSILFHKTYLQANYQFQVSLRTQWSNLTINITFSFHGLAYTINSTTAAKRPRWRHLFVLFHTFSPSSPVATFVPKPNKVSLREFFYWVQPLLHLMRACGSLRANQGVTFFELPKFANKIALSSRKRGPHLSNLNCSIIKLQHSKAILFSKVYTRATHSVSNYIHHTIVSTLRFGHSIVSTIIFRYILNPKHP